jgi:hypothetical protein
MIQYVILLFKLKIENFVHLITPPAACLSFVSQVGTSKEACKSAQNRSLEIILATVNGALKRDDTEIVSFCLDACSNVLLANPDSPASCFDAWVKISSSSEMHGSSGKRNDENRLRRVKGL